ncbi:MAG TPA: Crp/Fnr family transcriptional regulator [Thermoanaerobaculia bacterium]
MPSIRVIETDERATLFEAGDRRRDAWFPCNGAVVSLLEVFADGATIEVGMIGDEGVVGLDAIFSTPVRGSRAIVQARGTLLRIGVTALRAEMYLDKALQAAVFRFAGALYAQLANHAACNRLHLDEQRAAHWLLWLADRSHRDELHVTQELLAEMLGTRRATVNQALARLEQRALVASSRGRIRITDRRALEQAACECYLRIREEYVRALHVV